jgi:hypothetical protein
MKLILENWNNYLNEESVPYEEIQAIIDGNQYLKGQIVASEETVYDLGDKYFLMSGVSHIAERHKDKCFPGSLFLQGDDLVKEAVLNIVRGMDPAAGKVLAVPSGIDGLGMERLVKATPEEIAGLEDYKMSDGTLVKIKKEGTESRTSHGSAHRHRSTYGGSRRKASPIPRYGISWLYGNRARRRRRY